MDGQLRQVDGRWQLRFTRQLAHPPDKVWRALTEPDHLAAWFPTDVEGDRATGAALRFVFRNGEGPTLDGEMLTYQPPALLEMRWGGEETLRFELQPEGSGTRLTFVNTFDQLGKGARGRGRLACLPRCARLSPRRPPGPVAGQPAMAAGTRVLRRTVRA